MPQLTKASEVFTETQAQVMMSIADAMVPHLEGPDAARVMASLPTSASQRQRELIEQFAREGFADHPKLLDHFAHQAKVSLSSYALWQITMMLSALSTRPGCLAMTGRIGPFHTLDRQTREAIILGWFQSPLTLVQKAASGLKGLSLIVYYRFHQPAWEAVGYSDGPSVDWRDASQADKEEQHYPYVFENDKIALQSPNVDVVVETDVLIIGSGAGGGVVAQYLAQRGVRVLVSDKGSYMRPTEVKGREDQGYPEMYEGEGLMPTEDGSVNVLAGSTFGGGTTVNWSASLKPRHYVREAWASKHGLPYYRSPAFSDDLNAVCSRMGCSIHAIKHNVANSLLALGGQRAGQPVEAVPQNSGGHVHYCGKCQLGCVSGHKQGGTITWLKDAAETGNAGFIINCDIDRILFDDKKAIGALATVDGRKVTIRANKAVVSSAGSINTPAILQRSPELKYNKQIGRNLHLHPTTVVTGYYDFPVNPWEGSLLTTVSNAAELVHADGWGCKIEIIASSPSIHAAFSNYEDGVAHKAAMLRYRHSVTIIAITRDREGGRVILDSEGKARMDYSISKHDQESAVQGILRATEIHMMAGASQIATVQFGVPPFKPALNTTAPGSSSKTLPESTTLPSTSTPVESLPRNLNDPEYVEWRKKVEKAGAKPYLTTYGSAHQMGSCRLGSSPKTSALDPEGRVWGAKNLYVADASCLPEASGVNPMITTMGTARGVARNIAKDLGVERPETTVGPSLRESRI